MKQNHKVQKADLVELRQHQDGLIKLAYKDLPKINQALELLEESQSRQHKD